MYNFYACGILVASYRESKIYFSTFSQFDISVASFDKLDSRPDR